ncbi:MAG TPA: hypothetical protein VF941_20755 [Clostridia bacterium]
MNTIYNDENNCIYLKDESIELKIKRLSYSEKYLFIEDTQCEGRDIALPRSKEAIEKLISMLDAAKENFV